MADEEYKMFCCKDVVPTCGFEVKAKTGVYKIVPLSTFCVAFFHRV